MALSFVLAGRLLNAAAVSDWKVNCWSYAEVQPTGSPGRKLQQDCSLQEKNIDLAL